MTPDDYGRHVRKVHLDLHLPEMLEGMFSRFDARDYIDTLDRANVNSVCLFALCHYGNCYYNTQLGHKHAQLKADYLGELTREAKKRDMVVLAYFSVAWNKRLGREHPEWRQVDAAGRAMELPNHLPRICLNAPFRDWFFGLVREVAQGYPVDGIWLDITYMGRCYCVHCRERFRAEHGTDMPADPTPGTPEARRGFEYFMAARGPGGKNYTHHWCNCALGRWLSKQVPKFG